MGEEIRKLVYLEYQKLKVAINKSSNDLDDATKNVDEFEYKMWNIEDEYCFYRRKRAFICFSHYMLMVLTFGIHTALSKKHYEEQLDDIEGKITENIFKAFDLKKKIKDNDCILCQAAKQLYISEEYSRNFETFLEFYDSLTNEEKEKYFSLKMEN